MRVIITSVGIGSVYPFGINRLVNEFNRVSPGYEIQTWANAYPPPVKAHLIENGYDYSPYRAKSMALKYALDSGADIAILMDASFIPIRPIEPLVDYIAETGYYLCQNGYNVGEWASDRCLREMEMERESAMAIEDVSSYCVGIRRECRELIDKWEESSAFRTIVGCHTNIGHQGRNIGWVSDDPRVRGHRHDQTVLSILAARLGYTKLVARPKFTAYDGYQTEQTVLVNKGIGL